MSSTEPFTSLTAGTPHTDDVVPYVDVHDTSMAATGTDKKTTVANLVGAVAGDKLGLTPTAVKTANYTAAAGDFVPCDLATTGSFAVTFPTAPADGTVLGVKIVATSAGRSLTLTLGGSDKFNTTSGSGSGSISLLNQAAIFQYKASTAVWFMLAGDFPVSQLDARYLQVTNNLSDVTAATARTNLGLGTAATANTGTGASQVPTGATITAGGPTGDATHVPQVTYNAAGQLTTVSSVAITGAGIDSSAVHTSDYPITVAHGGTSQASAAAARGSSGLNLEGMTTVADADKTAAATDRVIAYTSLTAARTVTLPAANAVNAGQALIIADYANAATATITISMVAAGADTIINNQPIASAGGSRRLLSDGSAKWITEEATRLRVSQNLGDLQSATTARTNLGLGTAAVKDTNANPTSSQIPLGGTITGAGPIGDATHVAQITYNNAGQLTTVSSVAISAAAGVAADAIWTTKGQIAGATGNAAAAALAVSSSRGDVVHPCSGETTGLIWGSVPSGNERYQARSGALFETFPRYAGGSAVSAQTSGKVAFCAIFLPKGQVVTNIGFVSAGTTASGQTHWWFTLADSSFTFLRSTADQTSGAWASDTEKVVALSSTFTTTYEGLHYIGMMMVATTLVNLRGAAGGSTTYMGLGTFPVTAETTSAANTTAPSDNSSAGSVAATGGPRWGYVT